eukprot:a357099_2.p2 GENE.a357099_2~~a357099_2.p2  ORF type:complete len:134 (+),score=51.52 a357099_2:43-402(+)
MVSFSSALVLAADPNAHNPETAITVFVFGCIVCLVLASIYFVARDVRGIIRDRRARRNGSVVESSHAKRLRALNENNMQDLDDPDAFLLSLMSTPTKEETRARNRLTVGSVEMADLAPM